MISGSMVGTLTDLEDDDVAVRMYPGYVHLIYGGKRIGIYDASRARALAAILVAAADGCGDD